MTNTDKMYKYYRFRSFAILWLVYAAYYFTRKNYSIAMSDIKTELHIGEAMLGHILTANLALYAIGMFINGMLGDKYGAKIMIGIGMLASAAMSICFGLSTPTLILTLVWAANGYFQSTGWSNCVKSMSHWTSAGERGEVMGFWSSCYQIGSVAAGLFAAFIIGKYGWRATFTAPAYIVAVVGMIYLFFHKDKPQDVGLPSIEEYHGTAPAAPSPVATEKNESKTENPADKQKIIMRVLSHPMVWLMGFSYFCLKFVRYSVMFWLPFYLTEQYGYKPEASGYIANLPEIAGFLGAALAGIVSDKIFASRRAPVCAIMLFCLAIACALQAKLSLLGLGGIMGGLCLINFMIYGPDSIMSGAAAMDLGGEDGVATAAGFINGCGSIGACIQGSLLGYIGEKFGHQYFFYIFIPLALVPAFLMLSQWNIRPKKAA